MPAETFGEILERADAFAGDWQRAAREIQFPRRRRVLLLRARPEHGPVVGRGEAGRTWSRSESGGPTLRVPFKYRVSRRLHDTVFARDAPLHSAGRSLYGPWTRRPRPVRKAAHALEQAPRCRSSAARTAAIARFPRSHTSAPSRSARRTSGTGRAGARVTGSARCTTRSASGRRRTSGSRRTARRRTCSRARSSSRTTRSRARARGRTRSSGATTSHGRNERIERDHVRRETCPGSATRAHGKRR